MFIKTHYKNATVNNLRMFSKRYFSFFTAENANSSQPDMKNKPPIGVMGPSQRKLFSPISGAVESKYKEPEKSTIPAIKQ